jgi:hypothetical protein
VRLANEEDAMPTHVTGDRIFCGYESTGEGNMREHGRCGGFPVDAIHAVRATIDPATAEVTA